MSGEEGSADEQELCPEQSSLQQVSHPFDSTGSEAESLLAGASRFAALASTGIALVGLMKLNLQGPGITETVKQLWRN